MINERLIKQYLLFLRAEKNFSVASLNAYQKDILQFTEYIDKHNRSIENIDRLFIRTYLAQLQLDEYKRNSVVRKIASLRSFFKYLSREKIVKINPFIYLPLPKKQVKLPKFLEENEINLLLNAPSNTTEIGLRDRAILKLSG